MNCPNCGNELTKDQVEQEITLPQAPQIVGLVFTCKACGDETFWLTRTDDPAVEVLIGAEKEAAA